MQTALHIAALVAQLKEEITGGTVGFTGFYKKLRATYFQVEKNRSTTALGFVYHPSGSGCFGVPASKLRLDTREKPWPIFGLDGSEVVDIVQPALDRIFEIIFRVGNETKRVVFEALGPNGNLWLLDDGGGKQATLRNRRFSAGEKYRPAAVSEQLDPRHVSPEQIHQCLAQNEDRSPLANLKHSIRSFNETMTREALSRSGVPPSDLCRLEPVQAEKLASAISEIAGRFLGGGSAYLYEIRGKVEIYPFKLRSVDTAPEKFRTLSLATMEMVNRRHSTAEDADKEKQALKAVARAIRRRDRLILNLQQDIDQASEYEQYRRYAELLQLNRDRLQKGMNRIEVEDILADPTRMVEILLDPAATPNENIESYFRRNRKGREGLDILKRRLEIVNTELTSLKNMLAELDTDFETAQKKYRSELAALMPREAARRAEPPRLPYRAATLSTGATVLIGRGGADNDRTTFEFARPYELWFHAQQCAGSHVVLKFPGKSFEPSRQEIEETAAIAAYHSKARNDSLVPVAYTVRKHVRKPRKAKPGLVILEHEKSVMVAPKKETGARER